MNDKRKKLIDELRSRQQASKDFYIQIDGEPFQVKLPRTLQWAALAATFPSLNDLIQFKESATDLESEDLELAANVVGLAIALQTAQAEADEDAERIGKQAPKNAVPTAEQIEEGVEAARGISDNELEQAFLTIFFESHLTHKRLFLEAANRAAELVASPGSIGKTTAIPTQAKPVEESESTDTSST